MSFPRMLLTVIAIGLFGPSVAALAARNYVVHQAGRVFDLDKLTVRKNEVVTFLNDDTVSHNIVSTSAGNEFNLGSQRPGFSTDVTFTEAGDVPIFCAIHPRMRMTIIVTE